ncbi:hypothetical protein K458DRAFT_384944 [Lentithecium fluviatile CBS 122367]|uniref:Uncharacterized protein n=1 Tax=Lentithecium fluviatile CBS 122367 TaxID=1168545 RepID=A0A6G1JDY2_9PLEO|nr:hypothetical protein K458DRAFT_384944 [Lentithecium fluviatile CBS 122367]
MLLLSTLRLFKDPTTEGLATNYIAQLFAVTAVIVILFSIFVLIIVWRHLRGHAYQDVETLPERPVTHAQLAALRAWTEEEISAFSRQQRRELRAQRDWTQAFVSERLREHCNYMEQPLRTYGTFETTPSSSSLQAITILDHDASKMDAYHSLASLKWSHCRKPLLPSSNRITQWPWFAICPHCQHNPQGQCDCIFDWIETDWEGDSDEEDSRPTWLKPHFIGDSLKGRYDRSMDEVYTLEEADTFVKDLWTVLFQLCNNDDILDPKIEEIIDRVVRAQPRKIFHPRCPRTFDVYDRMLLSRNLPVLMKVVKRMVEELFALCETRPLHDDDEKLRRWRKEIGRALG